MIKRLLLSFILILGFAACDAVDGEDSGVFIRVRNNSDVTFDQVTIITGNREGFFGTILPRENSDYQQFETAFRYGSVFLRINGKPLQLVPNDYVGETPLRDGFYTYKIGLSSANLSDASLTFEFSKD